jgi:hypothetical protein
MRLSILLAIPLAACAEPVLKYVQSDADAHRVPVELQSSHIQSNVPDEPDFSGWLQRDLNAYFAARGLQSPRISFEMLRREATQSGVAYPKFYLWVRIGSADQRVTSGAVRVAAVQRERFEITDFLSTAEIIGDPDRVGTIFPALLVPGIIERARSEAPHVSG